MSDLTEQSSSSSSSESETDQMVDPSGSLNANPTSRVSAPTRGGGRGRGGRGASRGRGSRGGRGGSNKTNSQRSQSRATSRRSPTPRSPSPLTSASHSTPPMSPELGAPQALPEIDNGEDHGAATEHHRVADDDDDDEAANSEPEAPALAMKEGDADADDDEPSNEDLEEEDEPDDRSSSLSEASSHSSSASPAPIHHEVPVVTGSRGIRRSRSSPLTDLSAMESDAEDEDERTPEEGVEDDEDSEDDRAPPSSAQATASRRGKQRVIESDSASDGAQDDPPDEDDEAFDADDQDGDRKPNIFGYSPTRSNTASNSRNPSEAGTSRDGTPAPPGTSKGKGRGRGRPRGAKKSFPTSSSNASKNQGGGRGVSKSINAAASLLNGFLTPVRATRATVTLPPGYIEGIGSSRWPKLSSGGSRANKTPSVEPSERQASEESEATAMTLDDEQVPTPAVQSPAPSPGPPPKIIASNIEDAESAEKPIYPPDSDMDDSRAATPNISKEVTPVPAPVADSVVASPLVTPPEVEGAKEDDVNTETEIEAKPSPRPRPPAKKSKKSKQKSVVTPTELTESQIAERTAISKRRRLSEGEIERNAQRNAARLVLLDQLAEEERRILDGTHPLVHAVQARLREEKNRRLSSIARTQSWREIAYDRKLQSQSETAWLKWASAKDQLRMDLFIENHSSLKQLIYEEKQFPFLRDHPLLMEQHQVPPTPYYRAPILEGNELFKPRRVFHAGHYLEAPPKNPALDHSAWQLSNEEVNADLAVLAVPEDIFGPPVTTNAAPPSSTMLLDPSRHASPVMATEPPPPAASLGVPMYPYAPAPAYYYDHSSQYGPPPPGPAIYANAPNSSSVQPPPPQPPIHAYYSSPPLSSAMAPQPQHHFPRQHQQGHVQYPQQPSLQHRHHSHASSQHQANHRPQATSHSNEKRSRETSHGHSTNQNYANGSTTGYPGSPPRPTKVPRTSVSGSVSAQPQRERESSASNHGSSHGAVPIHASSKYGSDNSMGHAAQLQPESRSGSSGSGPTTLLPGLGSSAGYSWGNDGTRSVHQSLSNSGNSRSYGPQGGSPNGQSQLAQSHFAYWG